MFPFNIILLISWAFLSVSATQQPQSTCNSIIDAENFEKCIVPSLEGKHKGEAGKICVIGGSTEYTGAPYFAAMSALKAGADLVYVITTESAAPIIKSYSPDLIVYPFLHQKYLLQIKDVVSKMHILIIGPGLGRSQTTLFLINEIIQFCKESMKPLVIDADGLYVVSKNISTIQQYPSPGVILTPNHIEADRLMKSISAETKFWYYYFGDYVSVLLKGKEDIFYSSVSSLEWRSKAGGTGRRAGGQGDILAGLIATFYNWGIKSSRTNVINNPVRYAQSIAVNAAANITRHCNYLAFSKQGRSMTASDMLKEIHNACVFLFKEYH